jgi:hypothetical protein
MTQYHYTYYSYEEFGRGYIGKRSCKCFPEEDVKYFGSYKDKTFKPTQKIILETYDTSEQVAKAEEILHAFYDVKANPHFVNQHNANGNFRMLWDDLTTDKKNEINKKRSKRVKNIMSNLTPEQKSERAIKKSKSLKKYYSSMTPEQRSERVTKPLLNKTPEQRNETRKKRSESAKKALNFMTPEQRSERTRKAQASITPEQRSESSRKASAGMTPEQRSERAKKANAGMTPEQRSEVGKKTSSQKWQCTVTGFITSAGNLARYQRARGIDTSNRVRLS